MIHINKPERVGKNVNKNFVLVTIEHKQVMEKKNAHFEFDGSNRFRNRKEKRLEK